VRSIGIVAIAAVTAVRAQGRVQRRLGDVNNDLARVTVASGLTGGPIFVTAPPG
jgi:hypothetical protein